jgi:hypothetical protein
MLMSRSRFVFALWGILLLWAFLGALVLAELLEVIPEAADVEAGAPDLDAEALTELGSGLKSHVLSLDVPNPADFGSIITELCSPVTSLSMHQPGRLVRHTALARPLYERLSVYRI